MSLGSGVRDPSAKCQALVEGADIRETGLFHECFVLVGRQDRQLLADRRRCRLGLLWINAR